jgi:hypothetical protein
MGRQWTIQLDEFFFIINLYEHSNNKFYFSNQDQFYKRFSLHFVCSIPYTICQFCSILYTICQGTKSESVMTQHVYSSQRDILTSLYQTRWKWVTYDGNAQANTYSTVKYDPSQVSIEFILRHRDNNCLKDNYLTTRFVEPLRVSDRRSKWSADSVLNKQYAVVCKITQIDEKQGSAFA